MAVRGKGVGGGGNAWERAWLFSWMGGVVCARPGRFSGKKAFSFYCTRGHKRWPCFLPGEAGLCRNVAIDAEALPLHRFLRVCVVVVAWPAARPVNHADTKNLSVAGGDQAYKELEKPWLLQTGSYISISLSDMMRGNK